MQFIYIILFLLAILFKEYFDNLFTKILPSLVILAGILQYGFFRRNKLFISSVYNKYSFWILCILLWITFLGIIRTNYPLLTNISIISDVINFTFFTFFIYISLSYAYRRRKNFVDISERLIRTFIIAISCITLLFFFLYVFFSSNQTEIDGESGVLLQALGIHFPKRKVPLINVHPNLLGIYTGGIFVMNVLYLFYVEKKKRIKLFLAVIAGLCFVFLLIVDSRGTFLNALLTLLIVILLHSRRLIRIVRFAPLLIPVLPILLLHLLPWLAESDLTSRISRSKKDLATGNSRATVWKYCYQEISDVKPVHLFGYGEYGHYKAGISHKYAKLFGEEEENKYTVVHNIFLQVILDLGYLGFFFLVLVLYLTLKQLVELYQRGYVVSIVLIAYILYYIFSGTTESVYGSYGRIYIYITFGVILISNVFYNEYCRYFLAREENA